MITTQFGYLVWVIDLGLGENFRAGASESAHNLWVLTGKCQVLVVAGLKPVHGSAKMGRGPGPPWGSFLDGPWADSRLDVAAFDRLGNQLVA